MGNKLKTFRKDFNLTQRELADFWGITERTLQKWEKGDGSPSFEQIEQLCIEYKISTSYFSESTNDLDINIGLSKKEYEALSETAKKQIRDFAEFVKNQDKK